MDLNKLDLIAEEKRVKSILKTPEGRQALRNVTGLPCFTEEELKELEKDKPRVVLLTPSHDQPKPETTSAFAKMQQASRDVCRLIVPPGVSSSVVHWIRNDLIVRADKTIKEYEYVLFMDDDIVPQPEDLEKLLSHKVDIIAGACTVRQDPPLPNFRQFDEATYSFTTAKEWTDMFGYGGLMEVGAVGTGFMLISKKALDSVGQYYLNCEHERQFLGMSEEKVRELSGLRKARAQNTGNKWWFEFLKHPLGDGEYGEDLSFCFKARQCGLKVYVDTSVRPGHVGRYAFGLHDYLAQYQEELSGDKKTVAFNVPGAEITDEMSVVQ